MDSFDNKWRAESFFFFTTSWWWGWYLSLQSQYKSWSLSDSRRRRRRRPFGAPTRRTSSTLRLTAFVFDDDNDSLIDIVCFFVLRSVLAIRWTRRGNTDNNASVDEKTCTCTCTVHTVLIQQKSPKMNTLCFDVRFRTKGARCTKDLYLYRFRTFNLRNLWCVDHGGTFRTLVAPRGGSGNQQRDFGGGFGSGVLYSTCTPCMWMLILIMLLPCSKFCFLFLFEKQKKKDGNRQAFLITSHSVDILKGCYSPRNWYSTHPRPSPPLFFLPKISLCSSTMDLFISR